MKHKLRAVMERYGHNQSDLANLLGITTQSVSIKINEKKDFTRTEIMKIIYTYNLTADEVIDIFFNTKDRYKKDI